MIDQVPEDSHSGSSPSIGMPATAEAVSWEALATIGMSSLPIIRATSLRIGPSTVPGATILPKIRCGRPSASITPQAQSPVPASRSWEVEAMVRSTACTPQSQ